MLSNIFSFKNDKNLPKNLKMNGEEMKTVSVMMKSMG
jgi:hypothetical protein